MSVAQPTYEESLAKIAEIEKKVAAMEEDHKDDMKSKKAQKEEDKETKDAFKKAQNEMKEKDKEHKADDDEREKVKDAFRKAQEEEDPEKKKEAMKKAIEEKEDYDNKESKKGRKAESEKPFVDKEKDAKIANLEKKYKEPLVAEILNATKILDPGNYELRLKELTAATLEEVEKDHAKLKPFMAGIGLSSKVSTAEMPTMVPFQASQAIDNPTDIFSASIDDIDFSKVPTSKILEMYQ